MKLLKTLRDPVSGLIHVAGAFLGVWALVWLITKSLQGSQDNYIHLVSFITFGVSVILLYTSSSLYHLLRISDSARIIFRKIDHSMIFVLIAGSYTPYCLIALNGTLGYAMFALVWTLVVVGLFIKIYWLHAPRLISTGLYLLMGWLAVGVAIPLFKALTFKGILWLGIGGLFYSVGAIIYGLKKPDPFPPYFGFHEIWHLFVLAGTTSHFISIATLIPIP
jgi:hemolysin III